MPNKIPSNKMRNLLRGLQNPKGHKSNIAALDHLRKSVTPVNAGIIDSELLENPLYDHLGLAPEFPKTPCNFDEYTHLASRRIETEIGATVSRANEHELIISKFLHALADLNQLILSRNLYESVKCIKQLIEEFGYSLILLRKIAFIYTHSAPDSLEHASCVEILNECGLGQRNLIVLGLVDLMGETYSFMSIRHNLLNVHTGKSGSAFIHNIASWSILPITFDPLRLRDQIQFHRQASLLDATILLLIHQHNVPAIRSMQIPPHANDTFSKKITDAWHAVYCGDFPGKEFYDSLDIQSEMRFYRQSSAWIELKNVSDFRATFDYFYCDSSEKIPPRSQYGQAQLENYFNKLSSLSSLACTVKETEIMPTEFSAPRAGALSASCAFIYANLNGAVDKSLSSHELIQIMSRTRDIALIAPPDFLNDLINANDADLLFHLILAALITDKTESDFDWFRLRRIFQDYVIEEHSSDVIGFFDHIYGLAPAVAEYFVDTCDEEFLGQLPYLIDESANILECRASILEWYSTKFNEPMYAERAKSLRLDQKLNHIRGNIDEARIYVDLTRFQQWLEENVLGELSSILRSQTLKDEEIDAISEFGTYADQKKPEIRMAIVLQRAFEEFCTNPLYGVASYLGRRIRHGTLRGTMLSKLKEIVELPIAKELHTNPQTRNVLESWLHNYEHKLSQLSGEYLQIQSGEKKKGAISTNIMAADKISIVRLAIKDISRVFREKDSLAYTLPFVSVYCWRLIETDLSKIRHYVNDCQVKWGRIDAQELKRAAPFRLKQTASDVAQLINSTTYERFNTLSSWFNRPSNLSPSAPLSEVYDALLSEIKEHHPQYNPTIENSTSKDLTLKGGAYHLVYDALYIIVQNAAIHGAPNGRLLRQVENHRNEDGGAELWITIGSDISDHETIESVEAEIRSMADGDIGEPMTIEGRSGIKKLLNMKNDANELREVEFLCDNNMVFVICKFSLLGWEND